ncbi:MAG TPA: TIGR04211 family SH3 domain-containing protein [Pseudomonadales bacterium]
MIHRLPAFLLLAGLLTVLGLSAPAPADAETAWVSDELIINFRSIPASNGRILKLLPAGTRLEVIERQPEGEWARVRTQGGDEGWVEQQYLVREPIAAHRLEAANREVERLTRTVADLREQLAGVQAARTQAEQSSSNLTGEVSRLEQELAEIKRISSSALETAAENQRLNELNARLRQELDALVEERDELVANSRQRWMMIGGGLVLGGLVLGMIVKSRPRRSAWT